MIIYLISCILILMGSLSASLNLEKRAQHFILETKQIRLPNYPKAFNPSLVRWKGELWMCFRIFPDPNEILVSHLGIVKLSETFEQIGEIQILHFLDHSKLIRHSLEDGRLITSGEHLYIIYNDHQEPQSRWLRRVCFAELDCDGDRFYCKNSEIFLHFEGVNPKKQEKNWTPFEFEGKILFSYSLQPHRIMEPLYGTKGCKTLFDSKVDIKWDWGETRGGTPAFLVHDEYLAFFHSMREMKTVHSKNKSMMHYFMGAYTFRAQPPFSLTRISKEPLVAKGFYKPQHNYHWGPRRVVYPCGYIQDENFIWVSYGREDGEMWIAKMDKKMLLDSLIPVSELP